MAPIDHQVAMLTQNSSVAVKTAPPPWGEAEEIDGGDLEAGGRGAGMLFTGGQRSGIPRTCHMIF